MPYLNRLIKLQNHLKDHHCDAMLIENPLNMLYLTGLNLTAGKLLVHSKGAHLVVDNRYFELCQKSSPYPTLQDGNPTFEVHLSSTDFSFINTLAFDSETASYKNYQEIKKCIEIAKTQNRKISLVALENPVKKIRSVKDEFEISVLREAAALGSKGFDFVCSHLKEGVTEIEIANELEIYWKRHGSKSVAFDPIIAFGANSSMPHYRASNEKLRKDHIVLIDIGVNYKNYHSDMTRVVFFGAPDSRLLPIYRIVKKAQELALEICKPGTLIGDIDARARDYIASQGYADNFLHSLGHGIGLEIHELPLIKNTPPYNKMPLEPGMVITIEPGIYLPGIGGIRLEDTIAINANGYENLTKREIPNL